jgi:hypothetical protein
MMPNGWYLGTNCFLVVMNHHLSGFFFQKFPLRSSMAWVYFLPSRKNLEIGSKPFLNPWFYENSNEIPTCGDLSLLPPWRRQFRFCGILRR